jgi:RNA methyltransferase, TrmH family
MLTKQKIAEIQSLHEKKGREKLGLFIVEGQKSVAELLQSNFEIESLFCTHYFADKYKE